MLLSFTPEQAIQLRQMLATTPRAHFEPSRANPGGRGRIPVLVRCTSATAAGGAEPGGTQSYPAVVVNISSLVSTQEDGAAVWLTVLDTGTSGVLVPVSDKVYYGLFAGNFDPFPSGATDPRPRVFATIGASGSAGVSSWKEPVRMATTVAGTLSTSFENGDTIDGVTLATGDRILIKNQSTQTENGIYTVNSSGAPTRATDADTGAELLGATVFVSEGTANKDTVWMQTTNAAITVGSSNIVWALLGPHVSAITVADGGYVGGAYSVTADDTWEATSFGITLPSAGTYLIWCQVEGLARVSSAGGGGGFDNATIGGRIVNNTVPEVVPITGDATFLVVRAVVLDVACRHSTTQMCTYVASGSASLELEVFRNSGPTYTGSTVLAKFGYVKLA